MLVRYRWYLFKGKSHALGGYSNSEYGYCCYLSKDAFEFQDILNSPVQISPDPYLSAIQQAHLYLGYRLEQDGLRQTIQTKLMRLMNEYIIEADIHYHTDEFMQAMQVNN